MTSTWQRFRHVPLDPTSVWIINRIPRTSKREDHAKSSSPWTWAVQTTRMRYKRNIDPMETRTCADDNSWKDVPQG